MPEADRDRQQHEKNEPPAVPADQGKKPSRPPLADRLREKLQRIRKDDHNVYPLY